WGIHLVLGVSAGNLPAHRHPFGLNEPDLSCTAIEGVGRQHADLIEHAGAGAGYAGAGGSHLIGRRGKVVAVAPVTVAAVVAPGNDALGAGQASRTASRRRADASRLTSNTHGHQCRQREKIVLHHDPLWLFRPKVETGRDTATVGNSWTRTRRPRNGSVNRQ